MTFHNPGAAGMLAAIFRSATLHFVPAANDFLSRADALVDGMAHLDRLKRAAVRSGTTGTGEPLLTALEAIETDLCDRIEETLSRGPMAEDLDYPEPAALVPVRTLNAWCLAGDMLRLGDRVEVPPGVAGWLRDHGKAKQIKTQPNEAKQ